MRVKDRVAIITGSGSGIGRATAHRLAEEGAKVVITDIVEERAASAAAEITSKGGTAIAVKADVSKSSEVENLINKTIEAFGRIDILVNNAGFTVDALIKNMTEEMWDAVVDTCLKGAFLCSKFASNYMIEQNYGKIVNISSRAYLGNPGQANYSSAKAGIVGLTRSLALELGRYNINVNAVAPGMVNTEGLKSHPKYDFLIERSIKNTPLKRVGEPVDIANVILFLVSDESSYITGDVLHVTGGRYA
ncbi:MAG: glucose 1-dehydrogenase [Peptococcaceae bacterium]|jgi:3-oxoacyl-[acyl-carrier protein] reductase|nr:MAG: glucose 1-dehydrogenase [Peptococcaceae bacterium]